MRLGSFELIYAENQSKVLPDEFLTFDASKVNKSDYREIYGFREFAEHQVWCDFDLSGLFSPKFLTKMGINYDQYNDFIGSNRGFDVYLFHPFVRELSVANHFLELAELEHSGITDSLSLVWADIFDQKLPLIDAQNDANLCCHCNFFLGSRRFWEDYSKFILDFVSLLESDKGCSLREPTPYTLTTTDDRFLPMGVFTFERSLSHFLASRKSKFKVVNYSSITESWSQPETFPGEAAFVEDLLQAVSVSQEERTRVVREQLVKSYYFRRMAGVLSCE